jgi:pyruvate kinase
MSSAYEPHETIRRVQALAKPLRKPVYVDLKGKQLRVVEWANLPEGPIVLNHRIKAELPAKVYFRGDDCCELREVVDGVKLYVDPLPRAPVGRGQAVNIIAKALSVEGGLLDLDHAYIRAALAEGITRFMLSFVENWTDVMELEEAIARYNRGSKSPEEYEIVFKIESRAGIEFVKGTARKNFRDNLYRLMAARDDLMIQIGACSMPDALRAITTKDRSAICASRLLLGLETGAVSMADLSDLEYMRTLGYKHFMLSDGISREHFDDALAFWRTYRESGGVK